MFFSFLIFFLPERPLHFLCDVDVEDNNKSEEPPKTSEPDNPQRIEQSPKAEPRPSVMVKFLPAHSKLFYRIDDSLKCLRVVHSKVCKHFTVKTDVLLCEFTHKLRISDAVLTCSSIDSLNPESAEIALLVPTVTVCVS